MLRIPAGLLVGSSGSSGYGFQAKQYHCEGDATNSNCGEINGQACKTIQVRCDNTAVVASYIYIVNSGISKDRDVGMPIAKLDQVVDFYFWQGLAPQPRNDILTSALCIIFLYSEPVRPKYANLCHF